MVRHRGHVVRMFYVPAMRVQDGSLEHSCILVAVICAANGETEIKYVHRSLFIIFSSLSNPTATT